VDPSAKLCRQRLQTSGRTYCEKASEGTCEE
jgi:hypothetical protein